MSAKARANIVVLSLFAFLVSTIGSAGFAAPPEKLRVLVLSGKNNHKWRETTPALKKIFEESGRFDVEVVNDPSTLDAASLSNFDVVVSNWTNFPSPEREWGEGTEKALLDFIRGGKGFVLFHGASACFYTWPEYQNLVGATWGKNTGHGRPHAFQVSITDKNHPVTRGMKDFTTTDELWHRISTQAGIRVLCKAFSSKENQGSGEMEPVALCTNFGKGRCFNLVLGHDVRAMNSDGWKTLMLRGAQWAATGKADIETPLDPDEALRAGGKERKKKSAAAAVVKVALVTGGHGFDKEKFLEVFDDMDGVEYTHVELRDHSEIFENIDRWPYDAIVFYHMTQEISPKRRKNFIRLLDRGVGVVALHHAAGAFQEWPEYKKIIGGKYYLKAVEEDGKTRPASTFKHDVHFDVAVKDGKHPITRGIKDFTIEDETYGKCGVEPDNRVLLTTGEPSNNKDVCWVRKYGKARICYLQLGHGPSCFRDPVFRKLTARAIFWCAAKAE